MFKKRRKSDGLSKSDKFKKLEELVLPNAKLKFCPDQLLNLNFIFHKRLQVKNNAAADKSLLLAKSVTERLVERLVCGAGILDPRFSSKFLIYNHNQENNSLFPTELEYLIRLDSLSTPALYDTDTVSKYSVIETDTDYPAAYARIRLHTSMFKTWGGFTNGNGYLRRDKVQARLVELLAQAASQETPVSPLHVDESVLCGTPGKIMDAASAYHIFKIPTDEQVFYGPGGNIPRFPDPRDFRLAIVDEPNGIRVRVEFLSPALSNISINVRILVAIGIDAWPSSTNFPSRIPLGHSDCLLYQQAAQTGMYLVGFGVQSSAWQIRLPAAEYTLLNHYGPNSTARTVLDVLYDTLDEIDAARNLRKHQASYKILNRYILLISLLEELEEKSVNPPVDLNNWSPLYLSTHVLKLLDKIIKKIKSEYLPNYFFKKSNLLVNPGHLCEDDFIIEANNVKTYIIRLFDEALMSTKGNEEFEKLLISQESEMFLLHKWKELVDGLLPPSGTRGRRFCFAGSKNKMEIAHTQYTHKQLEYIGLLLKNMLNVRQNILQADNTILEDNLSREKCEPEEPLEDIIFILVTLMDQARDQYLLGQTNPTIMKNKIKIKIQYSIYTSKLVELIRKDKEILSSNYEDDLVLVMVILKWLYKAMDQNKRYLAPILRPYLNKLFNTSHSISWHMDSIKQRLNHDELSALGSFAKLVNTGKITPAEGLMDAVNKNWTWAREMLRMVERNTLRVVFISGRGKVYRHILSLPSYNRDGLNGSKTLGSTKERKPVRRQKTMPNRSYFNSILKERSGEGFEDVSPKHDILKKESPLNLALNAKHRRGEHRCSGDIFKALLSMQKLSVFQEVTSTLPQEDRTELLTLIQNLNTKRSSKSSLKKWSSTLPQLHSRSKITPKKEDIQKYTPKEESAGIRIEDKPPDKSLFSLNSTNINTLIGTCRAARIKEDSSVFLLQDSFKVKSLLNKSESFKY